MKYFKSLIIALIILAGCLIAVPKVGEAFAVSGCNYFASPNGGGNGLSQGSPFQISNFWSVASAGKTLCLLDGSYTGTNSMIAPPNGLSGTLNNPISIFAINDGAVLIDGQNSNIPVILSTGNNYFDIEGINAAHSATSVLEVVGSHNIFRRIVAWDASYTGNEKIIDVSAPLYGASGDGNLFEDIGAFGTARKSVSASAGATNTTFRRVWAMWNGSISDSGPKETFTVAYDSYNNNCDNCIGTRDEETTPPDSDRVGILSGDRIAYGPSNAVHAGYYGSIAYVLPNQSVADSQNGLLLGSGSFDYFAYKDVVVYIAPGTHLGLTAINGKPYVGSDPVSGNNRTFTNITEIGATPADTIDLGQPNGWVVNNLVAGPTVSSVPNIWTGAGSNGARVCYQYQNGVLTQTPLWPWPMDQRISDALASAGRTRVNVTQTMESIFGTIPAACKTGAVSSGGVINQALTSNSVSSSVTVDGSLAESAWASAPAVTFSNSSLSNNTVTAKSLWNSTNLYFGFDVTDASLEAVNDSSSLSQDDGADVYIDTANNKSTSVDSNDFHVIANISNLVSQPGVTSRKVNRSGGYTMEISIPWSALATTPSTNKIMGLLLGNNDRDNGSVSQFDWQNIISTGSYSQPNLWGSITLSGNVVDVTPPIISAITSSAVSTTGATVTWTTDELSDSQMDYGLTTSYGSQTTLNSSQVTSHSQSLTGLTAGTLYHYRVKSKDAAGNITTSADQTFTTTSAPDTTVPTSTITSPSAGTVSATITFSASASDPAVAGQVQSGLNLLTLSIDGATYATSTTGSISKSLNTTSLTNASHTLTAQAKDNAGNISTLSSVTITVNNAPAQKFPRVIQLTGLEGLSAIPASQAITVIILSGSSIIETQNLTPTAGKYTINFLSSDPQNVDIRVKATGYLSQLLSGIDTTVNSAAVISIPQLLAGDLNNDNVVNTLDYSLLNSHWLQNFAASDINKDNLVNSLDFAGLKNNWNKTGQ